jgi:hypothetical protein
VVRLLDAVSTPARDKASRYAAALKSLGGDVEARLAASASVPPRISAVPANAAEPEAAPLEQWFVEVARERPLVVAVDNVDDADDASLGLIVALAKASAEAPILLMVTERWQRIPRDVAGLNVLRALCTHLELPGLSPAETLELVRGLFGDAPNAERFAEWMYGRTAGSPLHCIEVSRQLVAQGVVRYQDGMWLLPADRFDTGLPAALEDALSMRLASLSERALALVECLSLQRGEPTLELCRQLVAEDGDGRKVLVLLDELARHDVFYVDSTGYRFSSVALREALLAGMDDVRRAANHRRLGEAFGKVPGAEHPAQRLEAGWHLIKGGDDIRGAEMIAKVTHSSVTIRMMVANLHLAGEPIEAALKVFKRHRRSIYQRVPLLAALSQAGYYEDRTWGDLYGDEALDACEDLTGVRSARLYSRFLGRTLGLLVGLFVAFLRFWLTPVRERGYSFRELLVQLVGTVTTITGTASLSLDVERATRVADALSVFKHLSSRLTPVGVYEFCLGLREIGRDQQATAFEAFCTLRERFEDPAYFRAMPMDARILYITGAHFARGAFAVYKADGRAALESADALDASGLKLYAMIASQLRFLYHVNRGEFAKAAPHREQVELHAAHVGSAWQVETWEPAALLPIYTNLSDIVALARTSDRLDILSQTVPSLRLYSRLSKLSQALVVGQGMASDAEELLDQREPRSFIGWSAFVGFYARGLNELGDYAAAKALCARALKEITDADREYVGLFLTLDLQAALADAGLGNTEAALARVDGLLKRFEECDHPMAMGLLHETRARICFGVGRIEEYDRSLGMVERWFRPTGTPALIAKWERLADLKAGPNGSRRTLPSVESYPSLDAPTTTRSGPVATISDADVRTVRAGARRSDAG